MLYYFSTLIIYYINYFQFNYFIITLNKLQSFSRARDFVASFRHGSFKVMCTKNKDILI